MIEVIVGLTLNKAKVAPPIKKINRWPAVVLPVRHIAKAVGRINSLVVLIISNIAISGMVVPWSSRKQNVPFLGVGESSNYSFCS